MYDATRDNLFVSVCEILKKYNLPWSKLFSMAIDGAPSMTGKNKGFFERLGEKPMTISNIHFIR